VIYSSPHVHTQFCDGRSTAEEMVRSALAGGCKSLGFSSHARQNFDSPSAMTAEGEQAYIAEIHRLQSVYGDRIRIWLGTELDFYSCADTAPYDYFIGSMHYLPGAHGFTAVDGSAKRLHAFCQAEYGGDGLALARDYYMAYAAMMRSRKPLIGGHLDLVRKSNPQLHLFDEDSPVYHGYVQRALDAALEAGVILEVNTGGMARYNAPKPYPDRWILERWHAMGGQVILASDCHYAPQLLTHYAEAAEMLKEIGYRTVRVLGTGDELIEETELD